MDQLFWILAGVVTGCVVGIVIIWPLEVRAGRRAADTRQVEAEVSARLKRFDPRGAVEAVDTRPIQAAPQPIARAAPQVVAQAVPPSWADEDQPTVDQQHDPADAPLRAADALPFPWPETLIPQPPVPIIVEEQDVAANGNVEDVPPVEGLLTTPELARVRAAELGRERRYLEQAIAEEQDRLAQLLHIQTAVGSPESAPIRQLQSELAQQRQRLEEIILLEERYRQAAVPSLAQMAQDYKNAASPHTPRAFGVRRHSLAPVEQPGKNPPAPPAQAATDSSS